MPCVHAVHGDVDNGAGQMAVAVLRADAGHEPAVAGVDAAAVDRGGDAVSGELLHLRNAGRVGLFP